MTFSRLCAPTALIALFLMSPVWGADLLEVYNLALRNDPLLREAEANRLASQESRPQARSLLLPQLSFSAGQTDQRQDGVSGQLLTETLRDSDSDQTVLTLQLTQTVFRWDQWLSLKQADKIVAQAEADYAAVKQNLILRVATGYFNVLAARDDLESNEANKEAIARQLEQSETRFEVGLIAITDVQESRAAYDQAVASEILAKRTLATARESLRELTGVYVEGLENPDGSLPLLNPEPADDEAWVSRAMEENLSLISSRLGVRIAQDSIKVQRAGHLPTLDLVVRRNEFEADTNQLSFIDPTMRENISSDLTTDEISLQLNFPIFSGGRTSSQVRESVHQHRAAQQRLERVAREIERQTRDAYLGVLSDISIVKALERALESTETALRATEAGFDVGTRTTVDVLDARRDLFTAQTNLERGRYDYINNILRLKQAAGTLSHADLEEINSWLN